MRTTYLGAASAWSTVATVTSPTRAGHPQRGERHRQRTRAGHRDGDPGLGGEHTRRSRGPGSSCSGHSTRPSSQETATFTVTGRGFTNTGLARGVTYHYRIRSFNVVGTSPYTGPVLVTTPQ